MNAAGYIFGESSAPANGTITGTVFVDSNGTGNPAGQSPLGGVLIALPGGVSLLGSIGVLQGERGHRTVGSSGASFRF